MGLPNSFPFEVMGAPFYVYVGALGLARPDIDAAPGVGWTLLGTNGPRSYAEEGVQLALPQSMNVHRGLGSAAPIKLFRSEEDAFIQVVMADMTLLQLRQALNQNALESDAGLRRVDVARGLAIATHALLVRGPSPYADDEFMQIWIPAAASIASVELTFRRDGATTYPLRWQALWYPQAATGEELGVIEAGDPTAT